MPRWGGGVVLAKQCYIAGHYQDMDLTVMPLPSSGQDVPAWNVRVLKVDVDKENEPKEDGEGRATSPA